MKRKRVSSILLAATLLATGCMTAGCGNQGTAASGTSEAANQETTGQGKEVRLLTCWNEDQDSTQVFKAVTDKYNEENPDTPIDLKIEVVAQADMNQKLSVLAASNDLPDVFCTGTQEYISDYVEQGLLKNIDDVISEQGVTDALSEENREALLNLTKLEELYVMPMDQSIEGIWYNKKIFAEHNLEVPKTIEEFMQVCETLKQAGIQPITCAGKEQWPITRLIGAYATQAGGTDLLVEANAGTRSWADESFLKSYQWLKDMGENGYFGDGITTVDTNTANSMFMTGSVAMQYNGSWFTANLESEENTLGEDVGMFAFPTVEGGKGAPNTYTTSYGMFWCFKDEAYDDAMGKWIAYMLNNYGDVAMETQGRLTAYKLNEEHEAGYYTKIVQEAQENAGGAAVWPEYAMPTSIQDIEYANAQLLVLGQIEPEAYGKALDDAMAASK